LFRIRRETLGLRDLCGPDKASGIRTGSAPPALASSSAWATPAMFTATMIPASRSHAAGDASPNG